jgi:FkbM family methyltransferase
VNRRNFISGAAVGVSGTALATMFGRRGEAVARTTAAPQAAPPAPVNRPHGCESFSQQGEDLVLFHLLRDMLQIQAPTYLDVGAGDPIQANNTYLLHWNGGHGVLVEPNPAHQASLKMHRPHDVIVQAGVGTADAREAPYYVFKDNPALNTFSADDVAVRRREAGHEVVAEVLKMPLFTINELIEKHLGHAPDLLSIDIEGWDLAVLRTLDYEKYRPAVIIAESLPTGPIPSFLASKRYRLRGASMYNAIFVDRRRAG